MNDDERERAPPRFFRRRRRSTTLSLRDSIVSLLFTFSISKLSWPDKHLENVIFEGLFQCFFFQMDHNYYKKVEK